MVGGGDFFGESGIAKLNLATQGARQAGSAFKPLVLAEALTQGISPDEVMPAPACPSIPMPNAAPWKPCNYGGRGGGNVTLTDGTGRSSPTLDAHRRAPAGPEAAQEPVPRPGGRSPLRPLLAA